MHAGDDVRMLPGLATFTQGDALSVTIVPFDLGDRSISPALGDTLSLALRGPATLDLACAPDAADAQGNWELSATSAQTATLTAAAYAWVYTVTNPAKGRLTVSMGQCNVLPDLTLAPAGYDARTTAQIALSEAEAALAAFKGSGGRVKTYTIAGRTVTYDTSAELLQVISYWRVRAANELHAQRAVEGKPDLSRLLVRFGGRA